MGGTVVAIITVVETGSTVVVGPDVREVGSAGGFTVVGKAATPGVS